jgi:hypothetical protein
MELAGLEPATSWVRSSRPLTPIVTLLRRFMAERLECRIISRNSVHRVLQRHEILDKSAGAIEESAGEPQRRGSRWTAVPGTGRDDDRELLPSRLGGRGSPRRGRNRYVGAP